MKKRVTASQEQELFQLPAFSCAVTSTGIIESLKLISSKVRVKNSDSVFFQQPLNT